MDSKTWEGIRCRHHVDFSKWAKKRPAIHPIARPKTRSSCTFRNLSFDRSTTEDKPLCHSQFARLGDRTLKPCTYLPPFFFQFRFQWFFSHYASDKFPFSVSWPCSSPACAALWLSDWDILPAQHLSKISSSSFSGKKSHQNQGKGHRQLLPKDWKTAPDALTGDPLARQQPSVAMGRYYAYVPFYSRFSSHHWSRGDNTKLPSWAFNLHMKMPPNTFWTPLSPKRAQLAHSDSELLISSLYLTLLSFSHPHFILPQTLSTIFHRTYARSTHSQNLKEKHSSTCFHLGR